ncbi:MAG: archaellin/type IV pilin N-terminal domain-containing protein [Desulfurococcaceae archaeon]
MKGVSGIVATAILLSITIAGGVLLYVYVSRYLSNVTSSSEIAVTNAYYISASQQLYVTVKNIGMSATNISGFTIILMNGTSSEISLSQSRSVNPGSEVTIVVVVNETSTPKYVIVKYDGDRATEPYPVRVIS